MHTFILNPFLKMPIFLVPHFWNNAPFFVVFFKGAKINTLYGGAWRGYRSNRFSKWDFQFPNFDVSFLRNWIFLVDLVSNSAFYTLFFHGFCSDFSHQKYFRILAVQTSKQNEIPTFRDFNKTNRTIWENCVPPKAMWSVL